jgi:hypothetical protein
LRIVGRALAINLRQRLALSLHPDVAVPAEHLAAGRNASPARGPVSVPGNAPARTAFDGQFPEARSSAPTTSPTWRQAVKVGASEFQCRNPAAQLPRSGLRGSVTTVRVADDTPREFSS